ncbi:MAG: hypothetical protein IKA82_03100 [Clostridia bacterium]|nr:hypothetical protein [Clostridia bacterium]
MLTKPRKTAEILSDAAYNRRLYRAFLVITLVVSLALVLYVGVSILGNPDMISYESIYYMINDFNIAALSVGEDYTSLQYGYSFGENQVFGAYRDGLVILNENTLTCFSSKGKRTLYERITLTSPTLCTSEAYVVAYEKGGKALYIYNSFTCLFTDADLGLSRLAKDYKIVDVSLADNGNFAVALNTGATHTVVLLFSQKGNLLAEYSLPRLVIDASLNKDATMIALASVDIKPHMGEPVTEIVIYRTDERTPVATENYIAATPVSAAFNDNSNYICALTDSIVSFNIESAAFSRTAFNTDAPLLKIDVSEHGCVAYFASSTDRDKFSVKVFDKTGNMVYNVSEDTATELAYHTYAIDNGRVLCGDDEGVTVINIENGEAIRINCTFSKDEYMLTVLSDNGSVFALCGGSEAQKFEIK